MRSLLSAWLIASCAIAGVGCTDGTNTQVLTGRVTTQNAVAVRAIDGDTIVTAGRVRSDGTFTLSLPAGHRYRLEVLTAGGVHNVVGTSKGGVADLAFKVCAPQDPFDMGGFGEPGMGGGGPGGDGCDPTDPNCGPPKCDPATDPMCVPPPPPCDPITDPSCVPPPKCDPTTDPNCGPPPCDPMADGTCGCDPTTDPMCGAGGGTGGGGGGCQPGDPNCMPWPCDPATDPMCKCFPGDPNCGMPCDPTVDATCPTPPPPCTDPMDPTTCKDPCMIDPVSCGCGMMDPANGTMAGGTKPDGTVSDDNTCWPPPEPCTMDGCPDDPWAPEHPPGDFGCKDGAN